MGDRRWGMGMEESEYISKLEELKSEHSEASLDLMALVEESVTAIPGSAKLWCLRGDLIQLSTLEAQYELEDVVRSYEKALSVDPNCAEAYESIGYFYDAVMGDPKSAEPAFQQAIRLGKGVQSYYGLARVLAELGRDEEALRLLTPKNCPYQEEAIIVEIAEEIRTGMWSGKGCA